VGFFIPAAVLKLFFKITGPNKTKHGRNGPWIDNNVFGWKWKSHEVFRNKFCHLIHSLSEMQNKKSYREHMIGEYIAL
jgi:hypothetical protein